MTLEQFKKRMQKMPEAPGVYFFLGKNKEVLYIGKATSLRDRVRSYFSPDLIDTRGQLLVEMVNTARSIDWRETDSVLEALILEANLIKTYKPKANTAQKDDKSWNYVVITDEDFPQVLLVRGKELLASGYSLVARNTFGPFPHGLQLRAAMKLIRRIFPYRDEKCTPCEALAKKGKTCRACFNRSIGLCPGVCTGEISKADYRSIVKRITLLFQGKKKTLIKSLERDMKREAALEHFEEAAKLRSQLFALQHIHDISLIKDEYRHPAPLSGSPVSFSARIEAYDVAHHGGSSPVGVMTVVEGGMPHKAEYRKFRIKTAKAGDDPGALTEVLSRRLGHDEWPLPRVIVVDGATAQMNAAQRVLDRYGIKIPIVGVVKDEKHRPREIRGDRNLFTGLEKEILLANSEAHRFAIGYHRKKQRATFTPKLEL